MMNSKRNQADLGNTIKRLSTLAIACMLLSGCADRRSADSHPPPVGVLDAGLSLLDLDGKPVNPLENDGEEAIVFLFTRSDCPISNRYAPEVGRLVERFRPRGINFYLVYVDPNETSDGIRTHMQEFNYSCRALRDPEHSLVQLSGAQITPEAAVFSSDRKLVYRGRINDQYVDFGKSRREPSANDLADALDAMLAGKPIKNAQTQAVGCYISDLQEHSPGAD